MICFLFRSIGNFTVTSELGASRPLGFGNLQVEDIAIILGCAAGLLLIVTLLITYCYCYSAKRKKTNEDPKETEKPRNGSVIVKSSSCQALDEEGRRGSVDSGIKEVEVRPLSPVQSWGATRLLQEHERRLSIHSSADIVDDQMVTMQPGMPSPFPDVTVTDYPHQIPTPTPSSTNTTNTYSTDPPPAYTQYPLEGNGPCCMNEYQTYNGAWDEPLTGHLLGRSQNGATGPGQIQGMSCQQSVIGQNQVPMPSASVSHGSVNQAMMVPNGSADRKRRNVTQV